MHKAFAMVAILIVATTSCSKSGTPSASGTQAPVTLSGTVNNHGTKDISTGSDASVGVEADNEGTQYYFNPTFIKATPGSALTVHVTNDGSVTHTFTIDSPAAEAQIDPGKSADVSVTLPASGVVRYYCRFHGGNGMQGAFYFVAGQSASTSSSPDVIPSY